LGGEGDKFGTVFLFFLLDLRRATRIEAGASVFDLGPRSTVQSQLHDFWVHVILLNGILSGSVAKCGRGGWHARGRGGATGGQAHGTATENVPGSVE
jgi:hypothetical protein